MCTSSSGTVELLHDRLVIEAATESKKKSYVHPPQNSWLPRESASVWGKLTAALLAEDWAAARSFKVGVEEAERALRRARAAAGLHRLSQSCVEAYIFILFIILSN